jgi:hypothetical protein
VGAVGTVQNVPPLQTCDDLLDCGAVPIAATRLWLRAPGFVGDCRPQAVLVIKLAQHLRASGVLKSDCRKTTGNSYLRTDLVRDLIGRVAKSMPHAVNKE